MEGGVSPQGKVKAEERKRFLSALEWGAIGRNSTGRAYEEAINPSRWHLCRVREIISFHGCDFPALPARHEGLLIPVAPLYQKHVDAGKRGAFQALTAG